MFPPREEFPQAVRNSEEEDAEGSFGAGEGIKESLVVVAK